MRLLPTFALALVLVACAGGDDEEDEQPAVAPTVATTVTEEPTTETGAEEPATVTFRTSDGVELSGTLRGEGSRAVVLAHMAGGSGEDWATVAEELAGGGRTVLAFDFRGHGDSGGTSAPASAPVDLEAAVAFVRDRGAESVVLVGASLGGMAVATVGGKLGAEGVAVVSAPFSFGGLDVLPADIEALGGEKLFVVAEGDEVAPDIREMFRLAGEPKRLEALSGSAHGTQILASPQGERLRALLLELATG
ncbi:MAG: alpha/beta hydrolase [Gaiellaceae bacterium]